MQSLLALWLFDRFGLSLATTGAIFFWTGVLSAVSYVVAVVTRGERATAASVTAVPRSLASALGPLLAGQLLALSGFGLPLVLAGGLKIVYDLTLHGLFRHVRPPEEIDRLPVDRQTAAFVRQGGRVAMGSSKFCVDDRGVYSLPAFASGMAQDTTA